MTNLAEQSQPEILKKSTSRIETGHAKNIANFDQLVSFAVSYGAAYNPSKASISLTALQTLSTNAKSVLEAVNAAMPVYSNAVAAREVAFLPLSELCTRVLNALKATDTTTQVDENARTLVRKIQGKKATPKKTDEEKAEAKANGKEIKEISASQMSYDNRLDNFDKLIKLLSSVALYAPNEEELKTDTLIALYNNLKAKNTAVVNAATALSNARLSRNNILYKENTGLVDIAADTKNYIKSVYGANSPQFKQISKLTFKNSKGK
jgi:hypothetical protein